MKPLSHLILSLSICFFSGCKPTTYQNVDSQIDLFVQEFLKEAEKRNIYLSAKDFQIKWGEMDKMKLGKCLPRKKRITFNQTSWVRLDKFQRKSLVFHELAHCLLGRDDHKDEELPRGECTSLLKTPEAECICDIYSKEWWEYYVDELFNENRELPQWYPENQTLEAIYAHLTLIKDTAFSTYFFDTLPSLNGRNIAIELYQDSIFDIGGNGSFVRMETELQMSNDDEIIISQRVPSRVSMVTVFKRKFKERPDHLKLMIFYDHQFWRYYINDQLVYKTGRVPEIRKDKKFSKRIVSGINWGVRDSIVLMSYFGRVKVFLGDF